jgi:hypothetical protein
VGVVVPALLVALVAWLRWLVVLGTSTRTWALDLAVRCFPSPWVLPVRVVPLLGLVRSVQLSCSGSGTCSFSLFDRLLGCWWPAWLASRLSFCCWVWVGWRLPSPLAVFLATPSFVSCELGCGVLSLSAYVAVVRRSSEGLGGRTGPKSCCSITGAVGRVSDRSC